MADINKDEFEQHCQRTDHTFSTGRCVEAAHPVDNNGWVEVIWEDGNKTQYPYVWLRDNCTCEQCFNASSLARLYLLRDLDPNIKPMTIKVADGGIDVSWPDGHQSHFRSQWLEGRSFTAEAKSQRKMWLTPPVQLWDNQLQDNIPSFQFEKLLEDDHTLYNWITALQTKGIALLQDAPSTTGQLHRVGERVAFLRKTNYGETFQVTSKLNPSNLAYTPNTLGLHTDLSFYQNTPGMQMLHCVEQVTSEGGDNIFADGFHAANVLKEKHKDLFDILTSTILDYIDIGSDYYKFFKLSRHPTIGLDAEGHVNKVTISHASRDCFLDLPLEMVTPLYTAIKTYTDILYHPDNHITYKLHQGDIICLHNYRMVHGRKAYKVLGTGNRHLEGGYIDWDEMNSRHRVLTMGLGILPTR